ncbi:hypothetical protein [Bifidobacterium aquikefiri]|uniref:hypothetical protein n=1 Tax=Bifidobacterium aquikefiri TaxID=1653207 RepID=UPI0013032678|nr:hypothetical protein [Bifidobacterium aquikefiri]
MVSEVYRPKAVTGCSAWQYDVMSRLLGLRVTAVSISLPYTIHFLFFNTGEA